MREDEHERVVSPTIHISSAIVSVLPAHREAVQRRLESVSGIEVRHTSDSKIVIVMEAAESGELGARLAEIACWAGVLSANMVFEQVEAAAD